ncbi:MAG: hypothetical protein IPM57_03925 [Oligoflexia bacterium]|nr:hypothetical protein [Oligoflexia bacterium]
MKLDVARSKLAKKVGYKDERIVARDISSHLKQFRAERVEKYDYIYSQIDASFYSHQKQIFDYLITICSSYTNLLKKSRLPELAECFIPILYEIGSASIMDKKPRGLGSKMQGTESVRDECAKIEYRNVFKSKLFKISKLTIDTHSDFIKTGASSWYSTFVERSFAEYMRKMLLLMLVVNAETERYSSMQDLGCMVDIIVRQTSLEKAKEIISAMLDDIQILLGIEVKRDVNKIWKGYLNWLE